MDTRKQFHEETGGVAEMSAGSVRSWNANYVEWLESRLESQQQRIRELEGVLDESREWIHELRGRIDPHSDLDPTEDNGLSSCLSNVAEALNKSETLP